MHLRLFFYLFKINKLLFFNLDADVAFFNAKIGFLIIILIVLLATSTFSVSWVMVRLKCHTLIGLGTKSGEMKM